jgi:Fe2+ transport system protein FeoA
MILSKSETGGKYKLLNLDKLGVILKQRVADMGLIGCDFLVVINNRGPVLIEVRGTRLAIGRGMAQKIEIEEV